MLKYLFSLIIFLILFCYSTISQEKVFTESDTVINISSGDYFSITLFSTSKLNGYSRFFTVVSDEPLLLIRSVNSGIELTKEDSTAEFKSKFKDISDITKDVWEFTAIAPGTVYLKTYITRSTNAANKIESTKYNINIK